MRGAQHHPPAGDEHAGLAYGQPDLAGEDVGNLFSEQFGLAERHREPARREGVHRGGEGWAAGYFGKGVHLLQQDGPVDGLGEEGGAGHQADGQHHTKKRQEGETQVKFAPLQDQMEHAWHA